MSDQERIDKAIELLRKGVKIQEERCYSHESWQWAMNEMSGPVNDAFCEAEVCFHNELLVLEGE